MNLRLHRIVSTGSGTKGVLVYKHEPLCLIFEDPWWNNQFGKSCIPHGRYTCQRYMSSKYGETFIVLNVQDRDGILFHWGNDHIDTRGCLLTGSTFGLTHRGNHGVLGSKVAFKNFMKTLNGKETFVLDIHNKF